MSPDDLRLLIQQRIDWEASVANFHPPDILFKPCVFGGVAAEEASPEARTAVPCDTLLYLHGGGYVAGSCRTHRRVTAALARFGGTRVISLDYRLAPEHPYPAALEDALAAARGPRHLGAESDVRQPAETFG